MRVSYTKMCLTYCKLLTNAAAMNIMSTMTTDLFSYINSTSHRDCMIRKKIYLHIVHASFMLRSDYGHWKQDSWSLLTVAQQVGMETVFDANRFSNFVSPQCFVEGILKGPNTYGDRLARAKGRSCAKTLRWVTRRPKWRAHSRLGWQLRSQ